MILSKFRHNHTTLCCFPSKAQEVSWYWEEHLLGWSRNQTGNVFVILWYELCGFRQATLPLWASAFACVLREELRLGFYLMGDKVEDQRILFGACFELG